MGYPQPPTGARPSGSNPRLLWILIAVGVVFTSAVVVASVYVFRQVVGAIQTEVARSTLLEEYQQYFYEVYELPSGPMFTTERTPMERLGNRTREMLRYLLVAQAEAAEAHEQHDEGGLHDVEAYSSRARYDRALRDLEEMGRASGNLARAHAEAVSELLPGLYAVATTEETRRIYAEQRKFHTKEAATYAKDSEIVARIVRLEKERAQLLWDNRRHLTTDGDGWATLLSSAPRSASQRVRQLESQIKKEEDARNAIYTELEEAFNRFRGVLSGDISASQD